MSAQTYDVEQIILVKDVHLHASTIMFNNMENLFCARSLPAMLFHPVALIETTVCNVYQKNCIEVSGLMMLSKLTLHFYIQSFTAECKKKNLFKQFVWLLCDAA